MIDFLLLLSFPLLIWLALNKPARLLPVWLLLSPLSNDMLVVFGVNLRVISFDRLAMLASAFGLIATGQFGELFPRRFSKLEKAYLAFFCAFLFEGVIKFEPREAFSVWTNTIDAYIIPFYFYLFARHLLTRGGKTMKR